MGHRTEDRGAEAGGSVCPPHSEAAPPTPIRHLSDRPCGYDRSGDTARLSDPCANGGTGHLCNRTGWGSSGRDRRRIRLELEVIVCTVVKREIWIILVGSAHDWSAAAPASHQPA